MAEVENLNQLRTNLKAQYKSVVPLIEWRNEMNEELVNVSDREEVFDKVQFNNLITYRSIITLGTVDYEVLATEIHNTKRNFYCLSNEGNQSSLHLISVYNSHDNNSYHCYLFRLYEKRIPIKRIAIDLDEIKVNQLEQKTES